MQHIEFNGVKEKILIGLIRIYQAVSSLGFFPWSCRFYPSCSMYAVGAIRRHGAFHGIGLTAARIFRCRPGHSGGLDPVP